MQSSHTVGSYLDVILHFKPKWPELPLELTGKRTESVKLLDKIHIHHTATETEN